AGRAYEGRGAQAGSRQRTFAAGYAGRNGHAAVERRVAEDRIVEHGAGEIQAAIAAGVARPRVFATRAAAGDACRFQAGSQGRSQTRSETGTCATGGYQAVGCYSAVAV